MDEETFNVFYLAHHLGRSVREITYMPTDEYYLWCSYFRKANGILEVSKTDKKGSNENTEKMKSSPLFAGINSMIQGNSDASS